MAPHKNQYGLSRSIPNKIKRQVRTRCGFGCVICGRGIVQYDHFDPEFADASEHIASGITLLCGTHHDEKKHGLLTKEQVAAYDAEPYCMKNGPAFGQFHLNGELPRIQLGSTEFQNCKVVLEVAGEKVIWLTRPAIGEEGFLLNALLRDDDGNVIFRIKRNEWVVGDDNWDVDTSGNGIVIRSRLRKISLILRFLPPDTLKVERARIMHKGTAVNIEKDGTIVDPINNITFGDISVNDCYIGIRFRAPGSVAIGCTRPRSLDTLIKLSITTAITPVVMLGSAAPRG